MLMLLSGTRGVRTSEWTTPMPRRKEARSAVLRIFKRATLRPWLQYTPGWWGKPFDILLKIAMALPKAK
jgi:hypothetical protein